MRLTFAGLLLLAVLAALPATVVYLREAEQVDRCLDAGGSVDYAHMVCDTARDHPYSAFEDRHRGLLLGTAAVLCAVVAGGVVMAGSQQARSRPSRPDVRTIR